MKTTGTIAVVARVSDIAGRDKKGDRFISVPEQIRTATAYCQGFAVAVFEDLNVSHTTPLDERPGMGEALRQVEAGQLVGIAVSSQDRIGPLMTLRELKARLLAAGGILKVADNPSAEALDGGYLKLPAEYMSLMHEAQREEIGLRWRAAGRNAAERGVLPFKAPKVGYVRNEKTGRVALDKRGARQILQAYEMRAAGESYAAIGRRFGWSVQTARYRLRCPTYMGVDGLVPAIVPRALWEAAQGSRTVRPIPPSEATKRRSLVGLCRCAGCGRSLRVRRRKRKNGSYYESYFCVDMAAEPCLERAFVQCDRLEELVEGWFAEALRSSPRMLTVTAAAADLREATALLEGAQAELDVFVEDASVLASRDAFRKGLASRQRRVDERSSGCGSCQAASRLSLPPDGRLPSCGTRLTRSTATLSSRGSSTALRFGLAPAAISPGTSRSSGPTGQWPTSMSASG